MDWGSVPAWLALIGGLVAVLTFVIGRLDARRAHATQVYAIVTHFRVPAVSHPPNGDGHVYVQPMNYGSAPIFDIGLTLFDWGHRRATWRLRSRQHRWTGAAIQGAHRRYATITPNADAEVAELPAPSGTSADLDPQVMLSFRDGNGHRWVRWPDGSLSSARFARRG